MQHLFLSCPDRPPTFLFCTKRLFNGTCYSYIISIVLLLVTTLIASKYLPYTVRAYRLGFYLSCFCSHVYMTNAISSMRRIIQQQTVDGHEQTPSGSTAGQQNGIVAQFRHFWREFFQYGALAVMVVLAGVFVHVISLYQITTRIEMFGFTGGSIVFKLLVQEAIKVYVIKRDIKDIRTMCVAVGLPTVLIDMQLRIALQRAQVSGLALSGTILMALAEICMRASKAVRIKYEIRSKAKATLSPVASASRQYSVQGMLRFNKRSGRDSMPSQRRASSSLGFRRWEENLLAFHTAEIYADMSAEYTTVGCSAVILFFYWDHPKYALASSPDATT
ncbi:hypothetical protein FI667_g10021, partial [Globisporangium splendens]